MDLNDEEKLASNLDKISYTLDKEYLSSLSDYVVLSFEDYCRHNDIAYSQAAYEKEKTGGADKFPFKGYFAIKINQLVYNREEKAIDCMKNILAAFSNSSDSLGFLIHRKHSEIDIYFVFKSSEKNNIAQVKNGVSLLRDSFLGNFSGSKVTDVLNISANYEAFGYLRNSKSISVLTSIPSDKSEDFISQGIEKLLNGVVPNDDDENEYSILILAQALSEPTLQAIQSGFEDMATAIAPFETHQFRKGSSSSKTNGESSSLTDTTGVSHAISKTQSLNVGLNVGGSFGSQSGMNLSHTDGTNASHTDGTNSSHTDGTNTSHTNGTSSNHMDSTSKSKSVTRDAGGTVEKFSKTLGTAIGTAICPGMGTLIGGAIGYAVGTVAKCALGVRTSTEGESHSDTKGESHSDTSGESHSDTVGESHSDTFGTSQSDTAGIFNSISRALNVGLTGGYGYAWGYIDTQSQSSSWTTGQNSSISIGDSEDTTYSYKSFKIKNLLEKLTASMKRLDNGKAVGFWKCATYVLSKDEKTSAKVANFLHGLNQGDESYVECSKVHTWRAIEDDGLFEEILKYLEWFEHPVLLNAMDVAFTQGKSKAFEDYFSVLKKNEREALRLYFEARASRGLIPVSPTTNITTTELAKLFSLPTHSLPSVPVIECAEFGRNIANSLSKNTASTSCIDLGLIFHMQQCESQSVLLDVNSLSSHVFITGSTGSGKSNTVYTLLDSLRSLNKKFLVIEPAKGEYKNVFGNFKDVSVYGTNPKISNLLKINPFSFPSDIHILEHLDRLIEIFNVCWPMYAAMPAVLKEAVEKSYEDAGWNLADSENPYGTDLYPTFADVTRNIKVIIDSSDYDAENKGAYKGSLVTRLKSLTNGINGQLFTSDEIENEDLFDENVIIDLSRVGSSETKSLIMGLLVLKLQEYRMTQNRMNAELQHVTVLEEAHNLLKKTSTEAGSESANLLGKSVEMLTNAIAEMRTYGEGFMIADQAPGLLDMAVIRNTNTKIIMRLPDLGDRELVGKAANLNDSQIEELAKLPRGVAAVYQNEWVQPVLCKVAHYATEKNPVFVFAPQKKDGRRDSIRNRILMAKYLCHFANDFEKTEKLKAALIDMVKRSSSNKFSASIYVTTVQYLDSLKQKPDYNKLSSIVSSLLPEFLDVLKDSALKNPSKVEIWRDDLQEHIENVLKDLKLQSDIELRNNILQCILQNYILAEINKPNLLNELLQRKAQ